MKKLVLLAVGAMLLGVLVGCGEGTPPSFDKGRRETENTQQKLLVANPNPSISTSLERKNLIRRLEKINQENMTSYIYLVSYGKVIAYYAVSGKVSSLRSYLVPQQQLVKDMNGQISTVDAPDLDGSYGDNVDGVFFFTTEGVYVEWCGEYLWSDQPLTVRQPVELIQIVPTEKKE